MLWDNIGIVAGEEYILQWYACLGYTIAGERSTCPEIGNEFSTSWNFAKLYKPVLLYFNLVIFIVFWDSGEKVVKLQAKVPRRKMR